MREAAALRQVQFRFDRVSDSRVANVRLDRLRAYGDLSATELASLGVALASKDVPLELTVHLEATNPETNDVTAKLLAMDWVYLVENREIVSGRLARAFEFPPGDEVDLPLDIRFDLYDAFGGNGQELFDTALALAGWRTGNKTVTLRITPTIETVAGPIRYPVPITLTMPSGAGS